MVFDSNFDINLSKEKNIYDNKNNNNGVLGVSTLDNVKYYPDKIGEKSYFEFKLVPEKQLQINNGLIVKVPQLPQVNNQDYLLPLYDESYCEMNNLKAECYSFPESNLLLLYFPQELTLDVEQTFRVYNITNPSYVSNFQEGMIVQSFDITTQLAVENFEFPNLDPFDYGDILYSKIRPSYYEAEKVYVDYEWIFIISNKIPKGGYITAYFPPNYYNLEESQPCPEIELKYGLNWIDEQNNPNILKQQCTDLYKTSTATIKDINEVLIQEKYNTTMIVINFKGVKNPTQENWTPYFGVSTHNEAGYIIDRKLDIQPVLIERKLNSGQINFLQFQSIPNNGNLLSTFYLDFEIQTSIPIGGQIKIQFPNTEFTSGFSQSKICKLIQPIQTFKSCIFDVNKLIITIELDQEIIVQFQSVKIQIEFPDIMNFNADLKSDVIKVTTLYDSIVLDESGQEDVNRRAQTVQQAQQIQNITLQQSIKNEANFSDFLLNFELQQNENINRIEIKFPQQFALLLGNQIFCKSNILQYGEYDQIFCEVKERIIYIYNLKKQENCPCQIDLQIYNILLPNYEYNNQIDNIALYVYKNDITVSQYTYNIGQIQLQQNSLPLEDISYMYSSLEPAILTTLNFDIKYQNSISYDILKFVTKKDMYLDYYNNYLIIKIDDQSKQYDKLYDSINIIQNVNVSQNQNQKIQLENFFVGYNYKTRSIPEIQLINKSQQLIVMKVYDNLIQNNVENITIKKQILKYKNQQIKLHEGTYTQYIEVKSMEQIENQEQPTIRLYDNYIKFDQDNIQWNDQYMKFRIASPLHEKNKQTFIALDFKNTFYSLPPIKVKVFHDMQNLIQVQDIDGIATGGFSQKLFINFQYAPFYQVTIILYALNTKNEILSLYPSKLQFDPGVDQNYFYIYSHYSSRNSELSFAFAKKESEGQIYQFENGITQKKVKIIEGEIIKPQLLNIQVDFINFNLLNENQQDLQQNQIQQDNIEQQTDTLQNNQQQQDQQQQIDNTQQQTDTQQQDNNQQIDNTLQQDQIQQTEALQDQTQQDDTLQQDQTQQNDTGTDQIIKDPFKDIQFPKESTLQLQINIEFDAPVVLHYAIYARGTMDITLEEIINKKLNYQNYQESIIFGTYLSQDKQIFQFNVQNVSLNKDLTLKIFPINNQGQIGEAIIYNFSTINYNDPLVLYLQVDDENLNDQDSIKNSLVNFLSLNDAEVSQDYDSNIINNYIESIYVSETEFQYSSNSFVPKVENEEYQQVKIEYKNQIQNTNKYIQVEQNHVVEEFNSMKKKTKKIKNYENFGYNFQKYENIQNENKSLQNQKLYQQEEGFQFDYGYQLFQKQQSQQQFRQDSLIFNTPPSSKFLRFIINNNTIQFKSIIQNKKYDFMDLEQRVQDIYYVNMKKKFLKWGQNNKPTIKKINTDSIELSNIQVNQPCKILYTVNPSIRVTYINKIQPPSLNLLFYQDNDTYTRKCLQSNTNILELKCYREENEFIKQMEDQYDIYDARNITKIAHLPTNEQIKNGLDPYNIKSLIKNEQVVQNINEDFELKINNLQPNTNYTIFMTLNDDKDMYIQEDQIIYFVFQTKKEIVKEFEKIKKILLLIIILL